MIPRPSCVGRAKVSGGVSFHRPDNLEGARSKGARHYLRVPLAVDVQGLDREVGGFGSSTPAGPLEGDGEDRVLALFYVHSRRRHGSPSSKLLRLLSTSMGTGVKSGEASQTSKGGGQM